MVRSTLRRTTTITDADEFEKRQVALIGRVVPLLEQQPGFVAHEIQRDGDEGGMLEVTVWETAEDCQNYLRNGAAAMAATILDAFFPTAPFPHGNWVRETVEA